MTPGYKTKRRYRSKILYRQKAKQRFFISIVNNLLSELVSLCAEGAQWNSLYVTNEIVLVVRKTMSYTDAIKCCQENFGQLIKVDTVDKWNQIKKRFGRSVLHIVPFK